MQIAERDKELYNIEKLLEKKNNDILQKYIQLKAQNKDSELLSEYETFFSHQKKNMESQIKALEVINKHLDKVSKMEQSQIDILNNIKTDQKKVFKEILKIKKDFDKSNKI